MVAQMLKLCGVGLETVAVRSRVIESQRTIGRNTVLGYLSFQRRWHNTPWMGQAEMVAQGINDHIVGIYLTIGRIACNMWRTDKDTLQQMDVQLGFVFPNVENGITHSSLIERLQQGIAADHLATTGIYNNRCTLQATEETFIGQMVGGILSTTRQGDMEGYDVSFAVEDIH